MSDTYFDLPSRMEDSFPEIDSDDCSFVNGIKAVSYTHLTLPTNREV